MVPSQVGGETATLTFERLTTRIEVIYDEVAGRMITEHGVE